MPRRECRPYLITYRSQGLLQGDVSGQQGPQFGRESGQVAVDLLFARSDGKRGGQTNESPVGSVPRQGIPEKIKLDQIFIRQDPAALLEPVEDHLTLPPFLNDRAVDRQAVLWSRRIEVHPLERCNLPTPARNTGSWGMSRPAFPLRLIVSDIKIDRRRIPVVEIGQQVIIEAQRLDVDLF